MYVVICFFSSAFRLSDPTMKLPLLLVLLFILPIIRAQVPHWGPCPEPAVQSSFILEQVQQQENVTDIYRIQAKSLNALYNLMGLKRICKIAFYIEIVIIECCLQNWGLLCKDNFMKIFFNLPKSVTTLICIVELNSFW